MEENKPHQEEPDRTKLPAEVRAQMLSGETSLFFNVARFEHAQRIADMFAKSTMVPDHFRGNTGNCMIGLNYASRVGADPYMMMQCMYVIHGKPGVEGKLVAGLINQSGKYSKPLQYEWLDANDSPVASHQVVNNQERNMRGCRAHTIDRASGEPVFGPKITWEIVYAEGWYGKAGSKWKTMPELMFMYRAASWFANIHCPEVKLGMATTEELRDIIDLQRTPNGTYRAADTAEDLKDKIAGAKADQDTPESAEEKTEEGEELSPLAQEFAELTEMTLSTFLNLRTKGVTGFAARNKEAIPNWPEHIKKHIYEKFNSRPEWAGLLKDIEVEETKEPEKTETHITKQEGADDQDLWNGLNECPEMDGEKVPKMRCRGCTKRQGEDGSWCPALTEAQVAAIEVEQQSQEQF